MKQTGELTEMEEKLAAFLLGKHISANSITLAKLILREDSPIWEIAETTLVIGEKTRVDFPKGYELP